MPQLLITCGAPDVGRNSKFLGQQALSFQNTLHDRTAAKKLEGLAKSLPLYLVGLSFYGVTAYVASPLSSYVTAARGFAADILAQDRPLDIAALAIAVIGAIMSNSAPRYPSSSRFVSTLEMGVCMASGANR